MASALEEYPPLVKKGKRKRSFFYNIRKDLILYLMFLPALVGFIVFRYIPAIGAFTVAFTRYNLFDGFFGSPWVGFRWLIQFINDPFFFRLIKNTLLLGFYGLVFGFPAPIILALLLNEVRNQSFKRISQTLTYLPHFISTVVIVGMIYSFFGHSGFVNQVLSALGLRPLDFLNSTRWFRPLYVGSSIWQGMGWGSIIYLASLSSINLELYESATIDGANRLGRAVHVTIPGIAPTITVLLILNTSRIINVGFEKVYLMMNPGIYSVADVIATYVYRRGIEDADYSYAAAVGLFNSVISLLLIFIANTVSRRVSDNSLW